MTCQDDRNGLINPPPADVVVVMVPFVAQGHLNQLLHLSRLISTYNIPVHFVNTSTHIHQLRCRLQDADQLSATSDDLIHFHETPTPPFASPPPDPSNLFPTHLQSSFESTLHIRREVADLILSLSTTTKRVAVIHDFLMSYVVQDVKSIPNAETYIFNPLSAFDTFWRAWERMGKPFPVNPEMLKQLPYTADSFSPEFKEFLKLQYPHVGPHVGELFDSSRAIEGEYLEYLEREEISDNKMIWAIGPFNHEKAFVTVSKIRHKCLEWLDLQPPNSVIYVSFGTTTTFSDQQIKQLAIGLERSEQRFVWVARAADKGNVFDDVPKIESLPQGFEERVEGRGLVVREWVPQTEILGHFATGGFMSHCGWNSSMESISTGIPIAAWPMHSDQPRNAFLIAKVLRIGLPVNDWDHRDVLVSSVVIENAVRRLMDSSEGEEMRKRSAELASTVGRSVAEGGECRKETDSFISYLRRQR